MTKKSWQLSRRSFIRGTGAVLALPFLEAMMPIGRARAASAGTVPTRACWWTYPGGTIIEHWKPEAVGPFVGKLPNLLSPLEFAREDLLILSGLSNDTEPLDASDDINTAHAVPNLHFLTGCGTLLNKNKKIRAGISVDQQMARAIGDQTSLSCLLLNSRDGGKGSFSWSDENTQVPYEFHPRLVFERMFGGRTPTIPDWSARSSASRQSAGPVYSRDGSVLDAVLEQTKDLSRRLGKADQSHMDAYLESVRSVEKRVEKLDAIGADAALAKKASGKEKDAFAEHEGLLDLPELPETKGYDIATFEQFGEHLRTMADLMVLAFQTDTTRVGILSHDANADWANVISLGDEFHHHTLQHNGNGRQTDPIAREALREVNYYYMRHFAYFIQRLAETPEVDGSLLDHSMVYCGSELGDGSHYRHDMPALVVGGANGQLSTGRHVAYREKTPITNLWVEMLNTMGVPTTEFGDNLTNRNAAYNGRLPGLSSAT